MKSVRCSGCGANLNFDGTRKIMRCQYCGTVYKDESKYVKQEPLSQQIETLSSRPVFVNEGFETRPRFSIVAFVLLFCTGFFPVAFIYWLVVRARQKEWDRLNRH